MHRNRRTRRAILELIGLSVLLVVAVQVWNGPAQLDELRSLAPDLCRPVHASEPVTLDSDRPIPLAPEPVVRAAAVPTRERSEDSVAIHGSTVNFVRTPRFVQAIGGVTLEEGRMGSAIRARFWDGVVEFGYPRRVIELVDNEVGGDELASRTTAWPRPAALLDELKTLESPAAVAWADNVRRSLSQLVTIDRLDSTASVESLNELEYWTGKADALIAELPSFEEQYRVRHATYALQRRLQLWRAVVQAAQPQVSAEVHRLTEAWDAELVAEQADVIQQWLKSIPNGEDWMTFLAIDNFATVITDPPSQQHVDLARETCFQIESAKMSSAQRAFLEKPLLAAYLDSLRTLSLAPLDFSQFLQRLEDFESSRSATSASPLVHSWNEIRRTPVAAYQDVAQILNLHYRNANIRVSMTEEFANRFLPAAQYARAPVREQLLGADIQGLSDSLTQLHIRFLPDPNEIRIKLEATGEMASETQSTKGPVTMFNTNRSRYLLQKLFALNPQGVRVGNTRAEATANTNLKGVRTRYDGMPIVGNMMRRIARQKHHESKPMTHRVLGDLIAMRLRQRLDTQLEQQMQQARQRLEDNVIRPLEDMSLSPEALAMQTTDDRLVMRGRLAGETQLAAYTARPQAVANNLLSVQVHESALNNFLDQMNLGGRYVEVRTLIQDVLDQWGLDDVAIPEDLPEDVKLELAADHPVVVRCDADRICVEIAVRRLTDEYSGRDWENFRVKVHFVPQTDGFSCELHRDGIVQLQSLESRRLSNRDQFALRAIFGRVFSKNHPIQVVTPALNEDPRLAELNVDQFVIRDGWIGISVGESTTEVASNVPSSEPNLH